MSPTYTMSAHLCKSIYASWRETRRSPSDLPSPGVPAPNRHHGAHGSIHVELLVAIRTQIDEILSFREALLAVLRPPNLMSFCHGCVELPDDYPRRRRNSHAHIPFGPGKTTETWVVGKLA
ncbi:hypothetical protein QIS74_06834 [Colletotrichum tabaci]|uniref:Uncharacterized protein n=1 Tax=Colletotrichum tabaci TaxID=1209068 RepID=A0AAV9TAN4_9PEZI